MANCLIRLGKLFSIYVFKSNLLIIGHNCCNMLSLCWFTTLTRFFINKMVKCLLWTFWKFQALTKLLLPSCLIKLMSNCFLCFIQSNWLILCHICNKMFRSSQFSILERFLNNIFAKCLLWSFLKPEALTRIMVNCFINFSANCFRYIYQSNWPIFGYICNKMYS